MLQNSKTSQWIRKLNQVCVEAVQDQGSKSSRSGSQLTVNWQWCLLFHPFFPCWLKSWGVQNSDKQFLCLWKVKVIFVFCLLYDFFLLPSIKWNISISLGQLGMFVGWWCRKENFPNCVKKVIIYDHQKSWDKCERRSWSWACLRWWSCWEALCGQCSSGWVMPWFFNVANSSNLIISCCFSLKALNVWYHHSNHQDDQPNHWHCH